jgi:hypothetical protein
MKTNLRAVTCECGNRIKAGRGYWNGQRFICPTCAPAVEETKGTVKENTLVIPEPTAADEEKLVKAILTGSEERDEIDRAFDGSLVYYKAAQIRVEIVTPSTTYRLAKAGSERAAIEAARQYGIRHDEVKLFYSKKVNKDGAVTFWSFVWTVKGNID